MERLAAAVDALPRGATDDGQAWWDAAQEAVRIRADAHGVPFRAVALATAALSPGLRWGATLEALDMLLEARARGDADYPRGVGHLTFGYRDRDKAWAILRGDPEAEALCSGPKVTAIAANLQGDLSRVAVDRHVIRAATGSDLRQASPVQSRRIELGVQLLARRARCAPAALQAALWLAGQ